MENLRFRSCNESVCLIKKTETLALMETKASFRRLASDRNLFPKSIIKKLRYLLH